MTDRERLTELQRSGIYPDLVDLVSALEYRLAALETTVTRLAELVGEARSADGHETIPPATNRGGRK